MLRLFKVRPTSPLLVRSGIREGLLPRSDTLASAIASLWAIANPGSDAGEIAKSPPFRLSSALPWVSDPSRSWHVLLPVPPGLLSSVLSHDSPDQKKLKKVLFADATLLRSLAKGESVAAYHLWDGGFLATSFPAGSFAHAFSRTRVSVDRLTGGPLQGLLFASDEWRFSKDVGFAVIADIQAGFESAFFATLRLLGLEGIGSDRSTGMGQFEVEPGIAWEPPALGSGQRLLLSLCRPTREDVEKGALDGRYTIAMRGGWITAPGARNLRRGRVRMLAEGSLVPERAGASPGDVFVVQEPVLDLGHCVYRDGRALTIPIGLGGKHA